MKSALVRVTALSLLALGVVVCAPPEPETGSPALELMMSRAFAQDTSQIQITVLTGANALLEPANNVDKRCVKDVAAQTGSQFLLLRQDENAPRTRSVAFDATKTEVTLSGIEPGSDYLFVAEAISRKSPPTLLASGRARYDRFEAKLNERRNITLFGGPDGGELAPCDPTVAP